MQQAAASVLVRAVALDKEQRFTEALVCYQEGLRLLLSVLEGLGPGERRKEFAKKINLYMDRAEVIKSQIQKDKESGKFHEKIEIKEDSTGCSYDSILGRFLDCKVKSVLIKDPYIRKHHQFLNLVHFCELLIKKCQFLSEVKVVTSIASDNEDEQNCFFTILQKNLKEQHLVNLSISYASTLHDRQIILNTGWVIQIGRGLDYFKPPLIKYGIGAFDLDFRPCRETTVDIYHQKNIKESIKE